MILAVNPVLVWANDLQDGIAADKNSEYPKAVKIFKSLAKQGNARAQLLYDRKRIGLQKIIRKRSNGFVLQLNRAMLEGKSILEHYIIMAKESFKIIIKRINGLILLPQMATEKAKAEVKNIEKRLNYL